MTWRRESRGAPGWASVAKRIGNPIDPDRPRKSKGGLGLENVSKRLRAIYKDDAQLQTSDTDGVFRSDLWLPAQTGIGIRRAAPVATPSTVLQ